MDEEELRRLQQNAKRTWRAIVWLAGGAGTILAAIAATPAALTATDPIQIANHGYVQDTVGQAVTKVTTQLEAEFMLADAKQTASLAAIQALLTSNAVQTLKAQLVSLQTAQYQQQAQVAALKAQSEQMPDNAALSAAWQTAQDNLDSIRRMIVKTTCLIDNGGSPPAGVC